MAVRVFAATAIASTLLVTGAAAGPQSKPMTSRATGTFDVTIKPQDADDYADGKAMGRMAIDKQYHGDLVGSAKGQMLTAMGDQQSAAYVAVEKFSGQLRGRTGTFAMHHTGVMTRGAPSLAIAIVPDSGTGELIGIAGTLAIDIAKDGTHSYTLQYTLPER
jgi:hypothetical protein